jgi:O-antigen/teichoic acid export membrane protein
MLSAGLIFLVRDMDTIMIQYYLSSDSVGIYDAGYVIGQTLTTALGAFGFLFLPLMSELHAEDRMKEINNLYSVVTKWVVFVTFPVLLIVISFPSGVIRHTFGPDYSSGSTVLLIIATTYFIRASMGPNQQLLSAFGETKFIMWVNGFVLVLNLILNIILIQIVGIVGAAIASFVSFTVMSGGYNWLLLKKYSVHPFSTSVSLPILAYSIIFSLMLLAYKSLINISDLVFWVFCLLAIILYPIIIIGMGGVQSEDVLLVNSAEDKMGVDLSFIKNVIRKMM